MEASNQSLAAAAVVATGDSSVLTKLLRNHVVSSRILGHLDLGSLQCLRQTCTTWNQAIVPELRNKHKLISFDDEVKSDSEDDDEDDDDPPRRKLPDFIQLMQTSSAVPFANYQLDIQSFAGDGGQNLDFFRVCGHTIKKLRLDSRQKFDENLKSKLKTVESTFLCKMVMELTPNLQDMTLNILPAAIQLPVLPLDAPDTGDISSCGRLRHLELNFDTKPKFSQTEADKKSESDFIFEILRTLFQVSPQLEAVTASIGVPDNRVNLPALFALQNSNVRLDKLRTLRLACLSGAELEALIKLATNLNRLHLHTFGTSYFMHLGNSESLPEVAPHLTTFLRTQAANLRSLELLFDGSKYGGDADREANLFDPRPLLEPDPSSAVVIPPLQQLLSLSLTTFFMDPIPIYFEGDGRLEVTLPRLRRLKIHFDYHTWLLALRRAAECVTNIHKLAHSHLRELELRRISLRSALFFWGLLYPRVTSLTLHHWVRKSDDLTLIWTTWPALQNIHIGLRPATTATTARHVINVDQFITGIPSEHFNQIEAEIEAEAGRMWPSLQRLRALAVQYKTAPGISDCQVLRSFTLEISDSGLVLTDIGGYFGLALASPTLQHIKIQKIKYQSDYLVRLMKKKGARNCTISEGCKNVISGALGPTAVLEFDASRWFTSEDKSDMEITSVSD